ncbi:MAG TPA: DcrB-related protein [Pyrinomonadaceae bacterium]|jgi:hypothetical protein
MAAEKFIANGWTADWPDGWEDRSMITLVGETDGKGFASNIVVTRQKIEAGTSLADFAAIQAEMMRGEIGTLQIIDERAIEINGLEAFQRLQRFAASETQIIQQVQTFFLAGENIFAVTGTAAVERFDRAIPAFKKFVETFRINQ